jgi:hypothetical protein
MQMGNVGVYEPESPVNSTAAITLEPETGSTLIPSLQPFETIETVEVVPRQEFPTWIVIGGLLALVWFLTKGR